MFKKSKKIGFLLLPITFISLTACAPMNSQFDCNKVGGEGAGCVSLDDVNQMANEGKFNEATINATAASSNSSSLNVKNGPDGYPVQTPFAGQPIWHDGDKQQIWIAPYVDTSGNFHEASYVYFSLSNGYWIGQPPSSIESDQD